LYKKFSRSSPAPLVKGGELIKFSSSPFVRRIEGDLFKALTIAVFRTHIHEID
jgi:hypothetical protein